MSGEAECFEIDLILLDEYCSPALCQHRAFNLAETRWPTIARSGCRDSGVFLQAANHPIRLITARVSLARSSILVLSMPGGNKQHSAWPVRTVSVLGSSQWRPLYNRPSRCSSTRACAVAVSLLASEHFAWPHSRVALHWLPAGRQRRPD